MTGTEKRAALAAKLPLLPEGWEWWEYPDGIRIWNPIEPSGHLSARIIAVQYDPRDPRVGSDFNAAVERGTAKIIELTDILANL